eukprot:gene27948-33750_t
MSEDADVSTEEGRNTLFDGIRDTWQQQSVHGLNPEAFQAVLKKTPMGRVGQPEEFSSIAAYFLMDYSSYITGQVVGVDRGFLRSGIF